MHALLADNYSMIFNPSAQLEPITTCNTKTHHFHVYRFSDSGIIEYYGFLGDPRPAQDPWA